MSHTHLSGHVTSAWWCVQAPGGCAERRQPLMLLFTWVFTDSCCTHPKTTPPPVCVCVRVFISLWGPSPRLWRHVWDSERGFSVRVTVRLRLEKALCQLCPHKYMSNRVCVFWHWRHSPGGHVTCIQTVWSFGQTGWRKRARSTWRSGHELMRTDVGVMTTHFDTLG